MSNSFPYTRSGNGWPGGLDDDGFVTPVVTQSVTPVVTLGVTPVVTLGVTPDAFPAPWGEGNQDPLSAGRWEPVPAEPAPPAGGMVDQVKAWLAKELANLPGRGLIDAYRNPQPATLAVHWRHISEHRYRPDDPWFSVVFLLAHCALTFPVKVTGKALTVAGDALTHSGRRIDLTGDRAARVVTVGAFVAVLVIVACLFGLI